MELRIGKLPSRLLLIKPIIRFYFNAIEREKQPSYCSYMFNNVIFPFALETPEIIDIHSIINLLSLWLLCYTDDISYH